MKALHSPCRKSLWGFTLLELLFAMAIVGILSALAVPLYQYHSDRVKISRVQGSLIEVMRRQAEYFSRNLTYTTLLQGDLNFPIDSLSGYTVEADACSRGIEFCVELTATPDDEDDAVLTLRSDGQHRPPELWD